MPKTIQIRDVDDRVYEQLQKRATEEGLSVPELLRREAARLASRPSFKEWFERTQRHPTDITTEEVLQTLDEQRGEWSDR